MKAQGIYRNEELESLVLATVEQIPQRAKNRAEVAGRRDQPRFCGIPIGASFEEFHLQYQQLLHEVNKVLQAGTVVQEVVETQRAVEARTRELEYRRSESRDAQITTASELGKIKDTLAGNRLLWLWLAVLTIALSDGIYAMKLYEANGFGLLESGLMGFLFAGILVLCAHLFKRTLYLGSTVLRRWFIGVAYFGLLTAVFIGIAGIRAREFATAVGSDTPGLSDDSWVLVGISLLCVGVATLLCFFCMPTRREKDLHTRYRTLARSLRKHQSEERTVTDEIQRMNDDLSELKGRNASIVVYGQALEEQIMAHARACYAQWREQNILYRTDGATAERFGPYPFNFVTHFTQFKSLKHESNT